MTALVPAEAPPKKPVVRIPARSRRMSGSASDRTAYTGASLFNRDIGMWRPPLRSADGEILRDNSKVRARARDLVRNNPFARQTVRVSRLGVVGHRFKYSCQPDHRFLGIDPEEARRWGQEWERIWESYAHSSNFYVDAGRRLNFTQLMGLVHDNRMVDGEALVAAEWDEASKWRTCFQAIDVDRLENPRGRPESKYLKAGVALSDFNAPLGYWIRETHPNDRTLIGSNPMAHHFVQRRTPWGRPVMMHSYEHHRASQTRGISLFAPVIRTLKMGSEYTEMALAAAVLQASFAAVLTSPSNAEEVLNILQAQGVDLADDDGDPVSMASHLLNELNEMAEYYRGLNFSIAGLKVPHLAPGDALDLKSPGQKAADFGEFHTAHTREIAAGTGTNPIEVSQNFANVNYSSAKMASALSFRGYKVRRADLATEFAFPMVGAVLEEVVFSGALQLPKGVSPLDFYAARDALIKGEFLAAGPPSLEPLKEANALAKEIENGTNTLQQACAERGLDYLDVLDQLATEKRDFEKRGLTWNFGAGMLAPVAEENVADGGDEQENQQ